MRETHVLISPLSCAALHARLLHAQALELSSLKTELDARSPPVRLVAIAGEHLGHEEFTRDYWKGELLFDLGKSSIFKVMGSGRQGLLSGVMSYFTGGSVSKNWARAGSKGVAGNIEGEGFKLGGVWLFAPSGLVYEHQEKTWGHTVEGAELDRLKRVIADMPKDQPGQVPLTAEAVSN